MPQEAPSIGWGAGLEVAREAKAAQEALRTEHFNEATSPCGKGRQSCSAECRPVVSLRICCPAGWTLPGLLCRIQTRPESEAIFGSRAIGDGPDLYQNGSAGTSKEILLQVLAANPRGHSDLQLAGEIFLSEDPQHALELLNKSEQIVADARTELLSREPISCSNVPRCATYIWNTQETERRMTPMCCVRKRGSFVRVVASTKRFLP